MRTLHAYIILFASLLLAGCLKEPNVKMKPAKVNLSISTRAIIGSITDGVEITKVRIIVTSSSNDDIVYNRTCPGGLNEEVDNSFILMLPSDTYHLFIIANETNAMIPLLNAASTKAALDAITLVTPRIEKDLVLLGNCNFTLSANADDPLQPNVVINSGAATWTNQKLVVQLIRLASKVSLFIKKNTTNAGDQFSITKVELIDLPASSYLTMTNSYKEALHNETPFASTSPPISFVSNDEQKEIFVSYIVPEYRLNTPTSANNATRLSITAKYNDQSGEEYEVVYHVPLLGNNAMDYSLQLNCHYVVTATITKLGEFNYTPYIEYEVSKWEDGGSSNIEFTDDAITFAGKWANSTTLEDAGNTARVTNNASVSYEFQLIFPEGAIWTAQLSNILDFDFDLTGGGVREGVTRSGVSNIIKIKPRRAVSTNNISTELYITVNKGTKVVELDINRSGNLGMGNRYVIKQIPN